jgi:LysM repeat protein
LPSHRAPKLKAARKHARALTICAATFTASAAPVVASAATAHGPSQPTAHTAAESEGRATTVSYVSRHRSTAAPRTTAVSNTAATSSYTVAGGDTLFAIAARTLGSGDKYWTLYNLNKNRVETGGERFTDPNLIRVGWTLSIPTAAASSTAPATTRSSTSSSSTSSSSTTSTAASTTTTSSSYSNTLDGWIKQAISILNAHGYTVSYNSIYQTVIHESAGNPSAVNRTDSNAAKGTPSIGLMQMIQPTFNAYALSGYGSIYNPVDNIIAGVIYAQARYGGLDRVVAARCGGSCWYGY